MIVSRALAPLALLVALVFCGTPLGAQNLPRLHVTALAMQSDRTRVAVGEQFHVTIHLHVAEHMGEPANFFLPDVRDCEIDGTERRVTSGPNGTDYREILTLSAHHPGRAELSPARFLAINAQTGIPSQFSSNPLTIVVTGPGMAERALSDALWRVARVVIIVTGLVLAALALVAIVRLRSARVPPASPPPAAAAAPAPAPVRPDRTRVLRDAFAALAASRRPEDALALRAALFAAAGAPPGATLRDALRLALPPSVRRALPLAEEAAFAEGPRRAVATDELLRIEPVLIAELA